MLWGLRKEIFHHLLQPYDSPQSQKPALLILISTPSHYLLDEGNQRTSPGKRNPMSAGCPVGLLLTHTVPLC